MILKKLLFACFIIIICSSFQARPRFDENDLLGAWIISGVDSKGTIKYIKKDSLLHTSLGFEFQEEGVCVEMVLNLSCGVGPYQRHQGIWQKTSDSTFLEMRHEKVGLSKQIREWFIEDLTDSTLTLIPLELNFERIKNGLG